MRFQILFGLIIGLVPTLSFAAGESQTFPYDAVVESQSAWVRSGGGQQFYTTKRLPKGAIVKVYRHDSGGWYMIAPPEGSFSWVAAKFVRMTGQNTGEVVEDNIVAYVGTDFGDDHNVWQRRLSPGETFQIIGEKTMRTDRGHERMLKIRSPRREWRWVAGQDVVAVNSRIQTPRTNGNSEFGNAPVDRRVPHNQGFTQQENRPPANDQPNWDDPNLKIAAAPSRRTRQPSRTGKEVLARIKEDRKQLDTLDANFRTIALSDKSRWNFSQLEAGYAELQANTRSPALRHQIKMRFAALQRYQQAKSVYDDITRLTSETDRRDAALVSMQHGGVTAAHMTSSQPTGQNVQMSGVMESGYLDAGAQLRTQPTAANPPVTRQPNPKGLIGAGIVESSVVPGTPAYVLLTPTGKILAYLESESVDLRQFVGKPMGLEGKRHYDKDLQTDFIKVQALKPVNLRK